MAEELPLVLVTGCSGFIGTQVCLTLLETAQYRVKGTVRSVAPDAANNQHLLNHTILQRVELVEADLLKDEGWKEALIDVSYVLHVASPFPKAGKVEPGSLVEPALKGTERVLRAAAAAGSVKRVVLTSSVQSVSSGRPKEDSVEKVFTEADWSNPDSSTIEEYAKSKTLAEKRAWELAEELNLELVVINPSYVLGPMIASRDPSSIVMCKRILNGEMAATPKLWINCVDVRDVADAHVKAMTSPDAAGKRFILDCGAGKWMTDIAILVKEKFPAQPVKTMEAPWFVLALLSLWDKDAAAIRGSIGKKMETYDCSRATGLIGHDLRSADEAIIAMCDSLLQLGIAKRGQLPRRILL